MAPGSPSLAVFGVSWEPHPEVWFLLAGLIGLAYYATKVIGPRVVPAGSPVVTRRQKMAFGASIVLLWFAADFPIHDIAEDRLYSVHMFQHTMLSLFIPPLLLLSIPTWLARLVIGNGRAGPVVMALTRPVVAAVVFNAVQALTHWTAIVNLSVENGPFHYALHVLVFTSALMVWFPVCGPLPERRISLPGQMVHLFLLSIIPTIPGAWLTFADGVVYKAYDKPDRLWGLSVTADQQLAGLIMKLGAGSFLWIVIAGLFFTWAKRHEESRKLQRTVTEREVLTWDLVEAEFDRLGAPPKEPTV